MPVRYEAMRYDARWPDPQATQPLQLQEKSTFVQKNIYIKKMPQNAGEPGEAATATATATLCVA